MSVQNSALCLFFVYIRRISQHVDYTKTCIYSPIVCVSGMKAGRSSSSSSSSSAFYLHHLLLSYFLQTLHSFFQSINRLPIHLSINPSIHTYLHPYIHSFFYSFIYSSIYSSIHPLFLSSQASLSRLVSLKKMKLRE